MPSIDYTLIRKVLEAEFATVEAQSLEGKEPAIAKGPRKHFDAIFASTTQAYREVLLGCILARLSSREIDIQKPYIGHGDDAYNGRTLDERVVNPFLHDKRIPCSRGPFLSTFRRSVMFDEATRDGLRDKVGYDSLLALIKMVAKTDSDADLKGTLRDLLFGFIRLRSAAHVPLARLHRISLEQYGRLIDGLLSTASGGRFPLMLAEVTFVTVNRVFNLDWTIDVQGINVADRPSGAGGDITIKRGTSVLMAAEVTERPVEKSRIMSTFQVKIAPQSIEDYLFLVRNEPDEEVMRQARQYFSQGHEVNFLEIKNWILVILATIGKSGRATFNEVLSEKLQAADVPAALKVAWNKQVELITSV
ncbi:MAG TPA: hypothetical protein VEL77_01970 [Rugosimonospora sp.]|nr:hypothetical protein [Rugosimonospora sp.]